MFSYIFMKILENRPKRYDTGINIISGGHADKIKKQIVQTYVKPGMEILDIGCGTGSLLIDAAKAGAKVRGVDISKGMLELARKKIVESRMGDRITVYNAGVAEISSLFEDNKFDLIISTLVFSELYSEEKALALYQINKLLKSDGTLVIAAEVRPRKLLKRIIHFFVRFPLAILTYVIAQTGTSPLNEISDEISQSGLIITSEDRSFLDSFTILTAKKRLDGHLQKIELPRARKPEDDFSIIKSIWDFIGRWFPNPVEPGLRIIGNPDKNSPVILTANFHLTVRRVEKSLKNENVFLLVAPSNGINIWCASRGGDFNTHSAITIIKTSRINERVDHNKIILPQFSASAIDRNLIKKETGRKGHFGPAYAKDIPTFLKNQKTLFENNKANFSLPFRLEMLLSMNFIIWIAVGVIILPMEPTLFFPLTIFFWMSGLILYAGYPLLPANSGWLKSVLLSVIEIILVAMYSVLIVEMAIFSYWKIMIMVTTVNLLLGFDLRGIVAGSPSEAEWLMNKLGMGTIGHLFSSGVFSTGKIQQNINKCNNCRLCLMVCPKNVFERVDKNKIRVQKQWECFACNACISQCAENALSIKTSTDYPSKPDQAMTDKN